MTVYNQSESNGRSKRIYTKLSTDSVAGINKQAVGDEIWETDTGKKYVWNATPDTTSGLWIQKESRGLPISTDPFIEVAKGNVFSLTFGNLPNVDEFLVHKFGRNAAVPNGSWAFVNNLGFTGWPLSQPRAVRIKAGGNANDTAAGTGAREITIQGLDLASGGEEVTETITTAGASASAVTTKLWYRIHRAWVSSAGTYGAANTGAITIENSTGGTDLIKIEVEEGQTQFAGYTIPLGYTAYLLSLHVTVDGLKPADIRLFTRADILDYTTAPFASKRLRLYFDGISGSFNYTPKSPEFSIPALSDIWVEAQGSGALTEVSANFELLLVRDIP